MTPFRYLVALAALALALFVGLAGYLHVAQSRAVAAAAAAPPPTDPPAPLAPADPPPRVPDLAKTLRALKLVTVEIDTTVAAISTSESWRGDVAATVDAPVRLYYGVDLAGLAEGTNGVDSDLLTGGVTLTVPQPRRLATEVFGSEGRHSVRVGWGRFRDVSGEYHLGLARTGLYERARAMRLSEAQRATVEATTREQLTSLVRAILGEPVAVTVRFEAEPGLATAPDGGVAP